MAPPDADPYDGLITSWDYFTSEQPDGEWGWRHITTLTELNAGQVAAARKAGWRLVDVPIKDPEHTSLAVFTDPRWEGDRSDPKAM